MLLVFRTFCLRVFENFTKPAEGCIIDTLLCSLITLENLDLTKLLDEDGVRVLEGAVGGENGTAVICLPNLRWIHIVAVLFNAIISQPLMSTPCSPAMLQLGGSYRCPTLVESNIYLSMEGRGALLRLIAVDCSYHILQRGRISDLIRC